MEHNLNRIQYVILNIMNKYGAVDHMHSMTCSEIAEREGCSKIPTIYKHVRILESYGLVTKGAKAERAYGYMLTNEAVKLLSVFNTNMED